MAEQRFLRRTEAAHHLTERGLPTAPSTLQKYASVGGGPQFHRWGNKAVYGATDLDTWAEAKLAARRRGSASEGGR